MALARKFYKLDGLHNIFQLTTEGDKQVYDTSVAGFTPSEEYGVSQVDEHTILFITCSTEDAGKYVRVFAKDLSDPNDVQLTQLEHLISLGDTMIWSRGAVYCVTTQSVTGIYFEDNALHVQYSDGYEDTITQGALGYEGLEPIFIDTTGEGTFIGIHSHSYNTTDKNFIENPNDNNGVENGVTYAHVEGSNNTATASYQHIMGKYAESTADLIFAIGNGNQTGNTTTHYNVFSVSFDGIAHALADVTAGPDKSTPLFKLSDIHSVLDDDWAVYTN